MLLKVIDGTAKGCQRTLCRSCAYGQIVEGEKDRYRIQHCNFLSKDINFNVYDCNKYYPANLPSITDMYRSAYILTSDKHNRQAGFIPYRKWQEENPNVNFPGCNEPNDPFRK